MANFAFGQCQPCTAHGGDNGSTVLTHDSYIRQMDRHGLGARPVRSAADAVLAPPRRPSCHSWHTWRAPATRRLCTGRPRCSPQVSAHVSPKKTYHVSEPWLTPASQITLSGCTYYKCLGHAMYVFVSQAPGKMLAWWPGGAGVAQRSRMAGACVVKGATAAHSHTGTPATRAGQRQVFVVPEALQRSSRSRVQGLPKMARLRLAALALCCCVALSTAVR